MAAGWSLANLHRDASLVPSLEVYVNKDALCGLLFGSLVLSLFYPVLHRFHWHFSSAYRNDLQPEQRVVVIQHSLEAIFFAAMFFPETYLLSSFNFESQSLDELAPKATCSAVFLGLVVVLYCLEIASRLSPRPLLLIHHGATAIIGVYCVLYFTEANIATASILAYFISFEAIIFVGLVMYRLHPTSLWTPRIIWYGMWVFGATRPLQVLAVFTSLIVNWDHIIVWQALLDCLVTIAFTMLQVYSLQIHYGMYNRSRAMTANHRASPYSSVEAITTEATPIV